MNITLLIVAMAVVSLAERASFLLLNDRLRPPPMLEKALKYVPAAVLAALVLLVAAIVGTVITVFGSSGVALGPLDVRLIAAALAATVAWFSGSVIGTLAAGMGTLWALTWLLG